MDMTPRSRFDRLLAAALGLLLGLALFASSAGPAAAQEDPPGRVGRVADLQGSVFRFDADSGQWLAAQRNRPLSGGDRLSTAVDGRAEVQVGSTTLRLGHATEIEVQRLDDERMVFELHAGALAVRVRSREVAHELEVVTQEAQLAPQRSGYYRIDRSDDSTWAGAWSGELQVVGQPAGLVVPGQRVRLSRDAASLRMVSGVMIGDEFADWAQRANQRDDERAAAAGYVSPEMTGADDLGRYGRWEQSADYGAVWFPTTVVVGWAPYRDGRWAWVPPWGWTWIDDAPWGFAPFHYGRWVSWGGRWGWCPGGYVVRPVYAPALVAWVGGANWSVSVNVGGPAVGWVPLAPREVYVPWYRHTPRYQDRLVLPWPQRRPGAAAPRAAPTGPFMYANQREPGGLTVVPRDVLLRREPVARAVIEAPQAARRPVVGGFVPPAPMPRLPRRAEDEGRPPAPPGDSDRGRARTGPGGGDRLPQFESDRGVPRDHDRAPPRGQPAVPPRAPVVVPPPDRPGAPQRDQQRDQQRPPRWDQQGTPQREPQATPQREPQGTPQREHDRAPERERDGTPQRDEPQALPWSTQRPPAAAPVPPARVVPDGAAPSPPRQGQQPAADGRWNGRERHGESASGIDARRERMPGRTPGDTLAPGAPVPRVSPLAPVAPAAPVPPPPAARAPERVRPPAAAALPPAPAPQTMPQAAPQAVPQRSDEERKRIPEPVRRDRDRDREAAR